jgi:hypothetical protein
MSQAIPFPFTVARVVGVQHRCKRTAEGAARPTAVALIDPASRDVRVLKLETEQDEIDFVQGRLPAAWRPLGDDDDRSAFLPRHVLQKKPKKSDSPDAPVRYEVPAAYEGLRTGDAVAMLNGGSGRALSIAIWDRCRTAGATLRVLTPGPLKDARDARGGAKEDDAQLIGELLIEAPERFAAMTEYDRLLAVAVLAYRAFVDTMKRRIAAGQQIMGIVRERAFVSLADPGNAAHGLDLEHVVKEALANDPGHIALLEAEKDAEKKMEDAMSALPTYAFIRAQPGVGPRIAARLVVSIGDMLARYEPPDPGAIAALRAEVEAGLRDGRYEELKDRVAVDPGKNPGEERYRRLGALIAHCRANSLAAEADRLQAARSALERIHRLKRKAADRAVAKLKHALGVHVRQGGEYADIPAEEAFPRRRKGVRANWDEDGRLGLWLLMGQFNRHPDWDWGKRLRVYKEGFQAKHPATVTVPVGKGKTWTKYTKIHLQQMAMWRTATRFVEWLGRELLRRQIALRREASATVPALRLPEPVRARPKHRSRLSSAGSLFRREELSSSRPFFRTPDIPEFGRGRVKRSSPRRMQDRALALSGDVTTSVGTLRRYAHRLPPFPFRLRLDPGPVAGFLFCDSSGIC